MKPKLFIVILYTLQVICVVFFAFAGKLQDNGLFQWGITGVLSIGHAWLSGWLISEKRDPDSVQWISPIVVTICIIISLGA